MNKFELELDENEGRGRDEALKTAEKFHIEQNNLKVEFFG